MKRAVRTIITLFIIIISLMTPAYAAEDLEYRLEELGLTVSTPGDLITFTRDIDPNDPNLASLGLDAQELLDFFNSKFIYLDAMAYDYSYEYSIRMPVLENNTKNVDFNRFTDDDIRSISGGVTAELEKNGAGNITLDVYQHTQTKFLFVQCTQIVNSIKAYTEMYYTVADGKAIIIVLDSYGKMYTDAQENTLKHIVDSVKFDKVSSGTLLSSLTRTLGYYAGKGLIGAVAGAAVGAVIFIIRAAAKKARMRREDAAEQIMVSDTPNPDHIVCPHCITLNRSNRDICRQCNQPLRQ